MGIGGGIALIVIGAILSFGVSDAIEGVDLTVIGYICICLLYTSPSPRDS